MWSGIWSVATTKISFWAWIWFTRHCGLGQEVTWIGGSVLEEKSSFKILGLIFSSRLNWGSYLISIAKVSPTKLEPWFVLWSFFLLRLLCMSINLPYSRVWNTVVMSELVLLVAAWNCWISCKNRYAGLLVLYLLPLLNPWLIVEL